MNTFIALLFQFWFLILIAIPILFYFFACVYIREHEVGIVIKRFASKNLPQGAIIAVNGEAGYQADTLPPGLHFGLWVWQYSIVRAPLIVVPQGGLALIVAKAGEAIPPGRILGRVVECDHFQSARA